MGHPKPLGLHLCSLQAQTTSRVSPDAEHRLPSLPPINYSIGPAMNVLSSSCGYCRLTVSIRRRRPADQLAQTSHCPGNPNSLPSLRNHSVDAARKNNLLLSSTAKTKPLNHTLELFYRLSDRDTVTWNTIISACLRRGSHQTALRLFLDMLLCCSHPPDWITMKSVLIACIESNDFYLALQMHSIITKLQDLLLCSTDLIIISTCLVNLYCHFGWVKVAHKLFGRIPDKDIIAFTSMIVGYTQAGEYRQALSIYTDMMEDSSVSLNEYAFSCALHASTGIPSLSGGRQIHAQVVKSYVRSDAFVGTALVDMYAKCNEMECAKAAFLDVFEPSVVAWNALLAGHLDGEEILKLFSEMRYSGVNPDNTTFANVLRACRDLSICLAQQIHGLVVKTDEVGVDVFVGGALFAIYIDQGLVRESHRIFHEIVCKDIVAFNLAIQGCIQNRYLPEALNFLYEALETLKEANEETITPLLMGVGGLDQLKQLHALAIKLGLGTDRGNSSISSSLLRVYSEYHCLDDALRIFECLHSPDLVTWTSLISGFSRAGESQGALNLYARMVSEGLTEPPNNYTFPSIISSCANLVAMKEGEQVHAQIIKSSHHSITSDPFVVSGLLHMYAKCGYIDEARIIFSGMKDRDLASWNAMITSLAQHGFAEEAVETFTELLNQNDVEPNHITFVGVLSACSHKGMVEKGLKYFKSIEEPTVDHYACLVNLLGRAGHLEEARHLVEEMPFEPNDHIWSSLLAACSIHGNIELGEYSAKHSLELNPTDSGTYVALSNMYAAAGRWNNVKLVRKLMRDQALRKDPGLSWLSIDQKTCAFFANDMFHKM